MKTIISYNAFPKLLLAFSFLFFTAFAQKTVAQEVITVQRAIEVTLKNNLQVTKSKLSEDLAEENFRQAKLAQYPTLSGSVGQDMNWGRNNVSSGVYENTQNYSFSPRVSVGLDLFNGFSKINQVRQNKILLESGKVNTDKIKNDLILQVVTSYMEILYNKDRLKASKQQLEVARKQLTQQQQLLDVGNKTLADLAESKSQVAIAELDVTKAENALTISFITLAQLMDIPSSTRFDVAAPNASSFARSSAVYDAEQVYTEALGMFPDVKLAGLQTQSAKKGIDIAKGNLYPRLSLSGGYGSFYNYNYNMPFDRKNEAFRTQIENNVSKGLGLNLSIPIFNGLQARSGVTKAKINLLQTQADEQITKNNLNKIIYQAVADLKAAESTYASATKAFEAQKEAFSVLEQRYNVGLVNSLDYSTSQTKRNTAEIDMIRAKYDLLFRAKVIDYYLGKQIAF
ncbi:TolC family protein [Pedobacter hiemivivus]|uniref:TolC family protein n=1 Tax=Pedobacter hiemivivus TaxID=2530454 RepID=A0A4U1GBY5_9SPHI|nr:TolC family protein [Pedobacter hiemivivus]TCC95402.1 TolC family protein [Pedobacter hiemivivus]TKC61174.1 TolC family protein [Pedobacter hiemivivus]